MSHCATNLDFIRSEAVVAETRITLRAPSVAVLLCVLRQPMFLSMHGVAGGPEGVTVEFEKKGRHLTYIRGPGCLTTLNTRLLKARHVCALGLGQRRGGDHSDKRCSGEEVADIHVEELCERLWLFEKWFRVVFCMMIDEV